MIAYLKKQWSKEWQKTLSEYCVITGSILLMAIGIYFFKFPNNFAFGGVTGFSTIVSRYFPISASDFTFIINTALLFIGFIFLGKVFGMKTVYASMLLSFALSFFERFFPLQEPLTDQPFLELVFAISLPGVASAVLFNIGASSGGTDIIAMILKKHTSLNIGSVLFLVDFAAVCVSFFAFGITTGLYSSLGLFFKSLVIDSMIESINQCKCFTIICDDPDPICEFIINDLHRSATIYEAKGAFTHHQKTIILTTMKRSQALRLRNHIHRIEPTAFMIISNSSEIIGKGFMTV